MLRQRIIASTIKFSELQERPRRRGSAVLMDDEELKKTIDSLYKKIEKIEKKISITRCPVIVQGITGS